MLAQAQETLGEVRVHGNHTTPDADVLALAGLTVGSVVSDESLRKADEALRASGRFASVELRKRYRSIDNPLDILVIVVVDEHASVSATDLTPGPIKRIRSLGMWLPIIDYEDGYGFTYGARVSFVDTLGPRSRISRFRLGRGAEDCRGSRPHVRARTHQPRRRRRVHHPPREPALRSGGPP